MPHAAVVPSACDLHFVWLSMCLCLTVSSPLSLWLCVFLAPSLPLSLFLFRCLSLHTAWHRSIWMRRLALLMSLMPMQLLACQFPESPTHSRKPSQRPRQPLSSSKCIHTVSNSHPRLTIPFLLKASSHSPSNLILTGKYLEYLILRWPSCQRVDLSPQRPAGVRILCLLSICCRSQHQQE